MIEQPNLIGTDAVPADRPLKPAVRNGLRLRCPSCGLGHLFRGYLKVNDHCPHCGEALYHQRADDGPAYLTILVVGHLVGILLPVGFELLRLTPQAMAVSLSALAVAGALSLLPRMKGLMIAVQWAKRMHGFAEGCVAGPSAPTAPPAGTAVRPLA